MQIGELEAERDLLQEQLAHMTEHKDSLQSRLDSANSQLALVKSQLSKERAKSLEAQVLKSSVNDP